MPALLLSKGVRLKTNHYSINLNPLLFLMFVKFQVLITPYSAVLEICRHIRFSFACFGAKCYGTVR